MFEIEGGWVPVPRCILKTGVWKNPNCFRFWMWCYVRAAYSENIGVDDCEEVNLQRGQVLVSLRSVSEETGLSIQEIRTCIRKLSSGKNPAISAVAEKSTQGKTLITLLKYTCYNDTKKAFNTASTQPQHSANTGATQHQHDGNTVPTQPEAKSDDTVPSPSPHAHAPARLLEKETKNHSLTAPNASDSLDLSGWVYQHALDVYKEESGITAQDYNTKEGAKLLAKAVVEGGLDKAHVKGVIKNGVADALLKHQGLRGIARNFARYIPQPKTDIQNGRPIVTWVCEDCGYVSRQYWSLPYEPEPARCSATEDPNEEIRRQAIKRRCKGRMIPNIASIRASPQGAENQSENYGVA